MAVDDLGEDIRQTGLRIIDGEHFAGWISAVGIAYCSPLPPRPGQVSPQRHAPCHPR